MITFYQTIFCVILSFPAVHLGEHGATDARVIGLIPMENNNRKSTF